MGYISFFLIKTRQHSCKMKEIIPVGGINLVHT